jgi:hypothetical protein
MPLSLTNLDQRIRDLMIAEIDFDIAQNTLYISSRLSAVGVTDYPDLLNYAARLADDTGLASQLAQHSRINPTYQRRNPKTGGYTTDTMNRDAHETLAEGEFNRFYIRALCRRAIDDRIQSLIICRVKLVANPRPGSVAREGASVDPKNLLADLRANPGVETALQIPGGPNSGLSARLP